MRTIPSSCRAVISFIALLLLGTSGQAFAQNAGARTPDSDSPEKGWFYYDDPVKQEEPEVLELPPSTVAAPPKRQEDSCKKKETWDPKCGFIDPGTDFAFQEMQRDKLLETMALTKNDPKSVESFQYYIKWVMSRASEVSNLWLYNMAQNPDLDPTTSAPISAIGIRLMSETKNNSDAELFKTIAKQGGFYVYFSRYDCVHCHTSQQQVAALARLTKLPIYNAALDNKCMPGMEQGCMTGKEVEQPAVALRITTVPALFLYVPANTWLRISTGVTDTETMRARTVSFFSAYRTALLKGISNGINGGPGVDFSSENTTSLSTPSGVPMGDGKPKAALPGEGDIEKILGKN